MAELPPDIPSGPVTYDSVTYQTDNGGYNDFDTTPVDVPASAPISESSSSSRSGSLNLNVYSTDYQVRGMGLCNFLSNGGYSSVDGSFIFPNRNLFGRGMQFRAAGSLGRVWDHDSALGDNPMLTLGGYLGKEVFPNLTAEIGYTFHHAGLEGYMAKHHDGSSHEFAQDINIGVTYDDHQRGFFGHGLIGYGFQGLNGTYMDFELGYRFTDVMPNAPFGLDLEVSAGVAPSFSYWGHGVDGVDACRIRVAAEPFSHNGGFGRDAHFYVKPWVQTSWSCNNARKIDRATGYGPVDHFQVTVGLDAGFRF